MRVKVSDGASTVFFTLPESRLSASLLAQLPLELELTDYAGNEKYVRPPRPLATDPARETECPAGSMGYFAPWNNLCFYFGTAPAYPGQYLLGLSENSPAEIRSLRGRVRIELAPAK